MSKSSASVSRRGRPTNPQARKERRLQILKGARACFIESGFQGASVAQIAERSSVSVANIYQYFENKDAIIDALVEFNLQTNLDKIRIFNEGLYDPVALRRSIHAVFSDPDHIDTLRLLQQILNEATRSEKIATQLKTTERAAGLAMVEALKEAAAVGNVSDAIDPIDTVRKISYFRNGLVARLAIWPSYADVLADQFADFILDLVQPHPKASA